MFFHYFSVIEEFFQSKEISGCVCVEGMSVHVRGGMSELDFGTCERGKRRVGCFLNARRTSLEGGVRCEGRRGLSFVFGGEVAVAVAVAFSLLILEVEK